MPAPSWPNTDGLGQGIVPLTTLTSLWHKPAAAMRTSTSLAPGRRTVSPSVTRASFPS